MEAASGWVMLEEDGAVRAPISQQHFEPWARGVGDVVEGFTAPWNRRAWRTLHTAAATGSKPVTPTSTNAHQARSNGPLARRFARRSRPGRGRLLACMAFKPLPSQPTVAAAGVHLGLAKRPRGPVCNPQAVTVSSVAGRSPTATRLRRARQGCTWRLAADPGAGATAQPARTWSAAGRLAALATRRFAGRLDGRSRPAR
jgi:hypothetical protein